MTDESLRRKTRELEKAKRLAWAKGLAELGSPKTLAVTLKARIGASRVEIEERGQERLRELIDHAATRVPFYRKHFGFDAPGALPKGRASEQIALFDFPIVTKQLRRSIPFDELLARETGGGPHYFIDEAAFFVSRTSGSSGVPTTHLKTERDDFFWESIAYARYLLDWGVPLRGEIYSTGLFRPTDPRGTGLHSSARDPVDYMITAGLHLRWNFFDLFQGGATRLEDVPQERLDLYEAMLAASGEPIAVQGAPSRMMGLVSYLKARGHEKRPKVVFTSYEPLLERDRRTLEETFRCPVVSVYSLSDVGTAAWECSARRLHFDEDLTVPEIVDEQGKAVPPGRSGRLILTPLSPRVMPILRVDTGDVAAFEAGTCACGKRSPSTRAIEGRLAVKFLGSGGRAFDSHLFLRAFDQCEFGDFQVVQERPGALRVVVAPSAVVPEERMKRVTESLRELLKEPFELRLDTSGAFVLTPSGKRNPAVQLFAEKPTSTV
jgi:phenylacetate-coenzyme A ligase PaaK-like adenylate-forming protein